MKKSFIIISFALLPIIAYTDERPTIEFLLDKHIYIADDFAGQTITLIKKDNRFYIRRDIFGSGIPIISTIIYSVEFDSNYQIRFSRIVAKEYDVPAVQWEEEFCLKILNATDIRLYLNGLLIETNY